ncbi:helix-turn-helix domain-containing protein [Microvirga rosea]|uniref:helix-turn-helix domain-containing protein n=1 Tax=Microvirga rosea TaxID=2715425 RepID=UPI001D0BE00A|nr:helix-turn-helix domain-containing protein [Microvirga rosea]MCB8820749.1 helix-turn-helix domain-containing protein [Microvirga rosea]
MTVIAMSRREIDQMQVLRDVMARHIAVRDAAQLLRMTRRQVFRILKKFRQRGPEALVSSRRGKPSNRSYPPAVRAEALALIRSNAARPRACSRSVDARSDGRSAAAQLDQLRRAARCLTSSDTQPSI